MRSLRQARGLLLFGSALACSSLVAPACATDPVVCTPASSGFGDQRRVVRRELPGIDDKPTCNPSVALLHTPEELRAAYTRAGIAIISENGPNAPAAIPLPPVDYATETVVFREAKLRSPASWVVTKNTTITIGSQGCGGADEICVLKVFAVDAPLVTSTESYVCEDINCNGSLVGRGGQ